MFNVSFSRRQVPGVTYPYNRRDANFLAVMRNTKSKMSHFGTVEEIFSNEEELIVLGNQMWHSALLEKCVETIQRLLGCVRQKRRLRLGRQLLGARF